MEEFKKMGDALMAQISFLDYECASERTAAVELSSEDVAGPPSRETSQHPAVVESRGSTGGSPAPAPWCVRSPGPWVTPQMPWVTPLPVGEWFNAPTQHMPALTWTWGLAGHVMSTNPNISANPAGAYVGLQPMVAGLGVGPGGASLAQVAVPGVNMGSSEKGVNPAEAAQPQTVHQVRNLIYLCKHHRLSSGQCLLGDIYRKRRLTK